MHRIGFFLFARQTCEFTRRALFFYFKCQWDPTREAIECTISEPDLKRETITSISGAPMRPSGFRTEKSTVVWHSNEIRFSIKGVLRFIVLSTWQRSNPFNERKYITICVKNRPPRGSCESCRPISIDCAIIARSPPPLSFKYRWRLLLLGYVLIDFVFSGTRLPRLIYRAVACVSFDPVFG